MLFANVDQTTLFNQSFFASTFADFIKILEELAKSKKSNQICICNVHTTMMAMENKLSHQFLSKATLSTMDGQPLVWLAKILGSKNAERIAGPDLMNDLCKISSEKGYRHFFYGGDAGTPERLKTFFENIYPGINIVGTYSPPFRPLTPREDAFVVEMINKSKPDFLWVGLGAPKQEQWIANHLHQINVPVQIGVGAAFDFFTGNVRRAPNWMQKCSLEWFYRFLKEPKRLWKRYLIYNTKFLLLLPSEILKHKFSKFFNN